MRAASTLTLLALFPLFAACQMFDSEPTKLSTVGLTRMQGELTAVDGKLLFQPCQDQRNYVVSDTAGTSILQEAASLAGQQGTLFADLRGKFSGVASGTQGSVDLQQLYRVERSTSACNDPDFKRMILRANGHKPAWAMSVTAKGMVLEREGQPPLAVPYVEEQLGDGRFNLMTDANHQHIELWVAPQRCIDSVSGSLQHMSAELRVNGQVQRGCAAFGGSRDD
ncbi:COG3650 family protein [Pseudomonas orientalis]|uniref:COG3650 family protein n=1 Tax=Pseudomonas orientalis TaxID=76758 RepID=UPI0034D4D38A